MFGLIRCNLAKEGAEGPTVDRIYEITVANLGVADAPIGRVSHQTYLHQLTKADNELVTQQAVAVSI